MAPSGAVRIRKRNSSAAGPLLNEYDRTASVPGTAKFTYWPGRNFRSPRFSTARVTAAVLSANHVSSLTLAEKVVAPTFAISEVPET